MAQFIKIFRPWRDLRQSTCAPVAGPVRVPLPCLIAAACLLCCSAQAPAADLKHTSGPARGEEPARAFSRRAVIVRFNQEKISRIHPENSRSQADQVLRQLGLPPGARLVESRSTRLLRRQKLVGPPPDFSRWMYLTVPENESPLDCVNRLRGHPLIDYAEIDFGASQSLTRTPPAGIIPSDPDFHKQYHHAMIDTPRAWSITTGSPAITVAVLDSGCSADQPEFAGRVVDGYDFETGDSDPSDSSGHGTAIAGILGANANNGICGAGIDWRCMLMPVKVLRGSASAWAQGIEWAVAQGCRLVVIAGMFSEPGTSVTLDNAIRAAVAAGVTVVAAAGNQNRPAVSYPAAHAHVIAVGAIDRENRRWVDAGHQEGSNYGAGLDLVAPGADIFTVSKHGNPALGSGTSAAASIVAGVCSLLLSVRPDLTPGAIRGILRETADKIGNPARYRDGRHPHFGYGRINAFRAVLKAYERPVVFVDPPLVELFQGDPPPERLKGVAAQDYVDGDLTAAIQAEGQVNMALPGEYTVRYSVADSHGNLSASRRRIYRVCSDVGR